MTVEAEKYVSVMKAFVVGQMSATDFVVAYMDLWRQDRDSGKLRQLNAATGDVFDRIFTASDVHSPDAEVRGKYGLDDEQLREFVKSVQSSVERLARA
jgi:hypothetical protein